MYKDKNIKEIILSHSYKSLLTQYLTTFDALVNNIPELNEKCNHHIDDHKAYGYFISRTVSELYLLLNELKVNSLLDLGCGMGIILKILTQLSEFDEERKQRLILGGIEIDETLVKYSKLIYEYGVKQGDILKLSKEDIKGYDVIYMWEPLIYEEHIKKLHDDLFKLMDVNQKIIFCPGGRMISYFENSKYFKSYNSTNKNGARFLICEKLC